jgi:hypothetical protein
MSTMNRSEKDLAISRIKLPLTSRYAMPPATLHAADRRRQERRHRDLPQ